jgi:1,4-dihydroxy-2-naphthoate octaprenyltransferase
LVPFIYAVFHNGNIINGIIASLGVVILHLGTNLFDDIVDYIREKKLIDSGIKSDFNFQQGKCFLIRNNTFTIQAAGVICALLFLAALLIGAYFIFTGGVKLLYVIIPTVIICLLYPLLGCLGLGEVLVAIVFSPLIYSGIYYVMTGTFSAHVMILSISTGLFSVAVLHNHMLLDYKFDTTNRKITLCRICGGEKAALYLLIFILTLSYLNILIWVVTGRLNIIYLLPFITIPYAYTLVKIMRTHIDNPKENIKYNIFMGSKKAIEKIPEEQRNFLMKFFLAQNILYSFSIILCISIIIDNLVRI